MSVLAGLVFAMAAWGQDPAELLELGRPAEAERALAAELRARPDDVRGLVLMGVALDQQQRFADAEPYYRRALQLAPGAAVLNNAGNHYLAAGKADEARRMFERAVRLEPHHANANLQLARLAAASKSGPEVLRCLDRLGPAGQGTAAARLLRARALAWTGHTDAASRLLNSLEAESKGGAPMDFSLGLAYADAKLYENAEAAFSRALAAAPSDRDILYNLGLAAIGARHYARAAQVLELALRQAPADVDALYALARSYAEAGNNEMALVPLVAARKADPKRTDVLEFMAHVSDALGYYGDAVTAYNEILALQPDNDIARRERGFCLVRADRWEVGIRDLESYAARYPKDVTGLFELALAESVRSPDKALVRLNQALALDPDHLPSLFSRGSMYLKLNRPAEAIADLQLLVQGSPDNVRALDRLGQAYLYLDQPRKAIEPLARAARLAPNDTKVLIHYSQALRFTDRAEEAREVLARFRRIPAETRRVPYGGVLDFLSLPPAEQRERYFEGLQKSAKINHASPDIQMRLANELLARGRAAEAVEAYRRAQSLDAGPARLAEISRKLLDAGEWAHAREFLVPLVAGNALPDARLDLAIATFHCAGPEAGLAELEKIPAAGRHGDYYLVRAQILDHLGRFEDAVAALNTGFRLAPTRAALYLEASQFLFKHQRYREAADLLEQAAGTVPDDPRLRLTRAIALELARRTGEALRELAAIQTRWPEWEWTYTIQGIILNINKKPAEARRALETAVALGASTPETYYFLALSIGESAPEEREPARRAVASALELNPDDPYARALAGKFDLADGHYQAAAAHLERAVQLFPDFFQAHYILATVYRQAGQEEKALAQMKEVRRIRQGRSQEELEMQMPPLDAMLFRIGR